jgi:hypothetical protein
LRASSMVARTVGRGHAAEALPLSSARGSAMYATSAFFTSSTSLPACGWGW